jgi:Protein of unknown function (DUF3551)
MQRAFLALLAAAALGGGVCSLRAVPAAAADFPFCIKGDNYNDGLGDCSFATYEQCRATASGRAAYCAANPYFSPDRPPSGKPGRRRY